VVHMAGALRRRLPPNWRCCVFSTHQTVFGAEPPSLSIGLIFRDSSVLLQTRNHCCPCSPAGFSGVPFQTMDKLTYLYIGECVKWVKRGATVCCAVGGSKICSSVGAVRSAVQREAVQPAVWHEAVGRGHE
jgi:hypothetical protein